MINDPSILDIDHVVPLKWTWQHGAEKWERKTRILFANDPINLIAVEASLNREKGAKGPDEWLPPKNECQYLSRFYRVISKYNLSLSPDEKSFSKHMLMSCGSAIKSKEIPPYL